jgi:hypothetical protein
LPFFLFSGNAVGRLVNRTEAGQHGRPHLASQVAYSTGPVEKHQLKSRALMNHFLGLVRGATAKSSMSPNRCQFHARGEFSSALWKTWHMASQTSRGRPPSSHMVRLEMAYTDSTAIWFDNRATDLRARANVDRSRYDQYLKLATAYDALAQQTERSSELVNRFVKPAEATSAEPPTRSRLLNL